MLPLSLYGQFERYSCRFGHNMPRPTHKNAHATNETFEFSIKSLSAQLKWPNAIGYSVRIAPNPMPLHKREHEPLACKEFPGYLPFLLSAYVLMDVIETVIEQ